MLIRTYKPLGLLTTVATISIALQAGIDVLTVFVTPLLNSASTNLAIETSPLTAVLAILVGFVVVMGFVALNATLFLVWIYRAAANLRAFGRTSLEFTPGAAVLWWFVPFANFIKPYQAVKEIVQASDPDVPIDSEYGSDWISGVVPSVVGIWWTLWIGRMVFNVATRTSENSTMLGIQALLSMVTAGACIVVMKIVSERQEALAAKIDLTSNMGHVPQTVE